jgi:hypothetical protein
MGDHDGVKSQPYEDPGWLPALKRVGAGRLRPPQRTGPDGVVITRLLFVTLVLAAFLLLFVLTFIVERIGEPSFGIGALVIALGLFGIASARWTANKELDTRSESALAESYRQLFFLGFALAEGPLLLSFTICMIREELWPYLVALPLYLVGMAVIAPSRRNLARRQERIQRQGSMLSLSRALSRLPSPRRANQT